MPSGAGEWAVRRYVPNPYRTKAERMEHGPMPRSIVLGNSTATTACAPTCCRHLRYRWQMCRTLWPTISELLRHLRKPSGRPRQPALHRGTGVLHLAFDKDFEDTPGNGVPLHKLQALHGT